jgi:hypothetical protein
MAAGGGEHQTFSWVSDRPSTNTNRRWAIDNIRKISYMWIDKNKQQYAHGGDTANNAHVSIGERSIILALLRS